MGSHITPADIADDARLTIAQAAQHLGVYEEVLRRAVREGRLDHTRHRSTIYTTPAALNAMQPGHAPLFVLSRPGPFIYFAGFDKYVKIGYTEGPLEPRLRTLQTACPERIILYAAEPGSIAKERELHRAFAKYRLQGEWFRRRAVINRYIAGIHANG